MTNKIGLGSILAVFLFSITLVSAQQEYNCPMGGMMSGYGNMMYGGYGSGTMIFGWVLSILVIALIAAAIYWLIKSANRRK